MDRARSSLERLVPEALDAGGIETLDLHLERYEFAAEHWRGGRILDLACGVGYGTRLLAERTHAGVVGVDVSERAIGHATANYAGSGIEYVASDALSFSDPTGFGLVVSLETVEHVADPVALIAHLAGLLRPGAILVTSVPTTPSVDINPYHRHDFDEDAFRRLFLDHGLQEVGCLPQVQPVSVSMVLRRGDRRLSDSRRNLLGYYLRHPGALLRRVEATLRHGLVNRYITIAWQDPREIV